MATDAIMALGAELMQRLHAEEEQAREEVAHFEPLVSYLQTQLGPDVRVLSSKLEGGPWRYFTMPLAPFGGLVQVARELVYDLKSQMKAFNAEKVDKVALDVQCGTVDWPMDKRRTGRVSLWF
jgi:hypothetical protein